MTDMARIIKTLDGDRQRLIGWVGQRMLPSLKIMATINTYRGFRFSRQGLAATSSLLADRPSSPRQPTTKERVDSLSGEQLGHLVPARKLIKALGFKLARQPGLKWLYRFRRFRKKLLE